MSASITTPRYVSAPATTRTSPLVTAAVLGLLGSLFIFGVGFAQPDALHNAAHDGRHTFFFPCH